MIFNKCNTEGRYKDFEIQPWKSQRNKNKSQDKIIVKVKLLNTFF